MTVAAPSANRRARAPTPPAGSRCPAEPGTPHRSTCAIAWQRGSRDGTGRGDRGRRPRPGADPTPCEPRRSRRWRAGQLHRSRSPSVFGATGSSPPAAIALMTVLVESRGQRSSTCHSSPRPRRRSRNGTASNASGPEHARALPHARREQLERDDGIDRGLPHDGLRAVARHRLRVVGDVVQVHLAGLAVDAGTRHPRSRARATVHAIAERRGIGQHRGHEIARRHLDAAHRAPAWSTRARSSPARAAPR